MKGYGTMKKVLIVIVVACLFAMSSCGPKVSSNHHDGKCDFCGRKTTMHYGGYEVCWKCYEDANKNWDKTH